jgi:hypothetical protein
VAAGTGDNEPRIGRLLSVIALVLAILYAVAILAGLVDKDDRLGTAEIILLIALLVLAAYSVEEIALGPTGFSARLKNLNARQGKLESEVRALQVTLFGLVTKWELQHLQELARPGPFYVQFSPHMVRELDRLHATGFVEPVNTDLDLVEAINAHDNSSDRFDLKQYVKITEEGRLYLKLREEFASEARP